MVVKNAFLHHSRVGFVTRSLAKPSSLTSSSLSSSIDSTRRHSTLALKMGLLDGLKRSFGVGNTAETLALENEKQLKAYNKVVEKINALEAEYENLSVENLQAKTEDFRRRLRNGASVDSLLVEAFAVVREASWRVLGLRHYDVQLIGGMALHDGRLAEMATGEGKTLVALLPAYLNALSGDSSFIVTTSDYLARRDGETMGQVFRYLGMSVGIIQSYQKEQQRKEAYECSITYVANQELGFDFLRDNLAMSNENVVQQRPFNFCVVDEADSILIDEARTPLIISRKSTGPTEKYITSAEIARNLNPNQHYEVKLKEQKVEMTNAGLKLAEQIVGKNLYDLQDPWAYYIINAIKAKELFNKDKEYIVKEDGTIGIIDSFSGRVLDGRRFTDGLQQSIEAKEKLRVSGETQVVAKVTYQNLFRLFPKLSGMTGTAFTEASEFFEVYQLKVLPIPTALPIARRDNPDAVFRTKEGKMKALLRNILGTHEKGRPILIGTTSIESSEEMIQALRDLNITAALLNARPENVEREAEIVAQAGRIGAVTVATNMAGRGTDILLGGSAKGVAKVLAKYLLLAKLGEITEISTCSTGFSSEPSGDGADEIETDEDVLSLPKVEELSKMLNIWLPSSLSYKAELALKRAVISCMDLIAETRGSSSIGVNNLVSGEARLIVDDLVAQAGDAAPTQVSAIRLLRKALILCEEEWKDIIKQEKEKVLRLGGLYVIGTSRHESRRIDNQLRGRAGRQGDPGASRFFLSLEDDIFRVFGADKMSALLESFRVADDMPIESDLVVQALDKVQTQVEEYSKATRQQVFALDEVTSAQRAAVYSQRRAFMVSSDEGMLETFRRFCVQTMTEIYEAGLLNPVKGGGGKGPVNANKVVSKAKQFFPNIELTQAEIEACEPSKVLPLLLSRLDNAIVAKRKEVDTLSTWAFVSFFRYLSMVQTDESWCKHLSRLELLKEEMVLQSFTAEKNVMDTYKERSNKLFETLMDNVRRNTVYSLFIYKPK